MANEDDSEGTINQKSFVKSIKKFVIVAHNPMSAYPEDKQPKIFLNYWKAITAILGTEEPTVLFKYNGVELFCRFCVPFMHRMTNMPDMKVSTMTALLTQTFDNMDGEYSGVGHAEFWVKGGKASFLNSGALNVINAELAKALSKSHTRTDVDV